MADIGSRGVDISKGEVITLAASGAQDCHRRH